jgi:hypothetical protein
MRRFIGRGLQIAGLLATGSACILPLWRETSEGTFMVLGFGGLAIFWIGSRVLGVGVV